MGSFKVILSSIFLSLIKNEKSSAISSEGVDIEYCVRNPLVLFKSDKPKRSEQVEHLAYLKLELLKEMLSQLMLIL